MHQRVSEESLHERYWNLFGLIFTYVFGTFFQGNKLDEFITNAAPTVVEFLQKNFDTTPRLEAICGMLSLLKPMKDFCNLTLIHNKESYGEKLNKFQNDTQDFYKHAEKSFTIGVDNESFYFHVLRFYLPYHAQLTFDRHQMGLGIFSMQGFERRNKESKDTLKRFSTMNRKCAAFLVNNIRRLLQHYWFEIGKQNLQCKNIRKKKHKNEGTTINYENRSTINDNDLIFI